MMEFFGNWGWLILSGFLLIIEIIAPAFYFLWFALAAFVVGILALFIDMGWQVEVTLFAVLSIVSTVVGRKFFSPTKPRERDDINNRAGAMIGRRFTLPAPILNGQGHVLVGDTRWMVKGDDLPQGMQVEVTGVSGAALEVRAVISGEEGAASGEDGGAAR